MYSFPYEIDIFPHIKQQKDVPITRENYAVDTDTVFRWTHIPYIVADIMRDYLDTCYNLSAMMKLTEVKKTIREIKAIEKDYLYDRSKFFKNNYINMNDVENKAIDFQEHIKGTINFICKRLNGDIEKVIPDVSLDMRMFIEAAYMAYFIHCGINIYTNRYIDIIREKFYYNTRNVMPDSFRKMKTYLQNLMNSYVKIDEEWVKLYSQEINTIMDSVVLFENGVNIKELDL